MHKSTRVTYSDTIQQCPPLLHNPLPRYPHPHSQQAMRMVDPSVEGFQMRKRYDDESALLYELTNPSDKRLYAIAQALKEKSKTVEEIHEVSESVTD